jgi:hypothetical protein
VQRSIEPGLTRSSYHLSISIALLISPTTSLEVGKRLLIRLVLGRRNRCGKQRRIISTHIIPCQSSILPTFGSPSAAELNSRNSVGLKTCFLLSMRKILNCSLSRCSGFRIVVSSSHDIYGIDYTKSMLTYSTRGQILRKKILY